MHLQRWVSSFAVEGYPAAQGTEAFDEYGKNGMVQTLALAGVGRKEDDPTVAERCEFWFRETYK